MVNKRKERNQETKKTEGKEKINTGKRGETERDKRKKGR